MCREGAQQSLASSQALVMVPVTGATAAQSSTEAALADELAGLKALLASVAPQLQELVGIKQQMGQLLSLLQPGIAGKLYSTPPRDAIGPSGASRWSHTWQHSLLCCFPCTLVFLAFCSLELQVNDFGLLLSPALLMYPHSEGFGVSFARCSLNQPKSYLFMDNVYINHLSCSLVQEVLSNASPKLQISVANQNAKVTRALLCIRKYRLHQGKTCHGLLASTTIYGNMQVLHASPW